jgi:hypothetical protein
VRHTGFLLSNWLLDGGTTAIVALGAGEEHSASPGWLPVGFVQEPCPSAVTGTIKISFTTTDGSDGFGGSDTQNITVNIDLVPQPEPGGDWQSAGGSWSEQDNFSYPCGDGTSDTGSASGSRSPLTGPEFGLDQTDLPTAEFWSYAYVFPPELPGSSLLAASS